MVLRQTRISVDRLSTLKGLAYAQVSSPKHRKLRRKWRRQYYWALSVHKLQKAEPHIKGWAPIVISFLALITSIIVAIVK